MSRLRVFFAALLLAGGLTLGVGVQPAHAVTYKVQCWSTTGSPYVSTSATSWSQQQAFLNCVSGLISRRWNAASCGGAFYSFYGSDGYHYGYAVEYPNKQWCNYSRGDRFNAKGFLSSYW